MQEFLLPVWLIFDLESLDHWRSTWWFIHFTATWRRVSAPWLCRWSWSILSHLAHSLMVAGLALLFLLGGLCIQGGGWVGDDRVGLRSLVEFDMILVLVCRYSTIDHWLSFLASILALHGRIRGWAFVELAQISRFILLCWSRQTTIWLELTLIDVSL